MNNNTIPASGSEVAMAIVRNNIWQHSAKKSVVSGLWLRQYEHTPLFANCFLYVLRVDKYKYFRYYMRNIALVSPGEAGLWVQGSEEERISYSLTLEEESKGKCKADWDVLKLLESKLKLEYQKYFPSTKGILMDYRYSLEEQTKIIGILNRKILNE